MIEIEGQLAFEGPKTDVFLFIYDKEENIKIEKEDVINFTITNDQGNMYFSETGTIQNFRNYGKFVKECIDYLKSDGLSDLVTGEISKESMKALKIKNSSKKLDFVIVKRK